MPTRRWSDLNRAISGLVLVGERERAAFARDTWPLQLARERRGDRPLSPDAVIQPFGVDDVRTLLGWCCEHDVVVVPTAGRSGVCGGVAFDDASFDGRPSVALDLRSLTGVEVHARDMLATAAAGTAGPDYERALGDHGLTGGHYPQSLAISTVGGWLACRSAGQFSTGYGKAEDMLAGMDVVLPSGDLVSFPPQPSSAAGPDLMRLFCGSEGTLGVIVGVTMRVVHRSEAVPAAARFTSFRDGLEAVRATVQQGLRPSVVRLYDPDDTALAFPGSSGCALVLVHGGPLASAEAVAVAEIVREAGGEDAGADLAEHWLAHRFDAVETLHDVMAPDGPLGPNVIVDTMEVAARWSVLSDLYGVVREALSPHTVGVLCHASHVYPDGACLYFTFGLRGRDEPDAERLYHEAWRAGLDSAEASGATITHHHGVGRLKADWLRRELDEAGWALLRSLKQTLDPDRILNPGNLGL